MFNFLLRVSVTCFALSYSITLVMDVSRLFFRAPARYPLRIGFVAVGLLTHALFLVKLMQVELAAGRGIAPLSSWFDWCLTAAWILAAADLGLSIRRPQSSVGLFLLPLVLLLIGLAWLVRDVPPFPVREAIGYWRWIHGLALLFGTVSVTLGFATGVMYLLQSYLLKHKLPPPPGLKLPSLEWLQRFNREALFMSTICLAFGVLSGVVLNRASAAKAVPWTDPGVLLSGALFLWLLAATMFEIFYEPARQGRKVAYLTLASFVFLAIALAFVVFGGHAKPTASAVSVAEVVRLRMSATNPEVSRLRLQAILNASRMNLATGRTPR